MKEARKVTDHNGDTVTIIFERRSVYIHIIAIRDAAERDVWGRYSSAQIQEMKNQIK